MKFEFEELKPVLFTMANKFVRQWPRFEFWEIVNEMWMSSNMQKITDIRMAWRACSQGFYSYLRKETGRSNNGYIIQKRQANLCSIEEIGEPSLSDRSFDDVENKDFMDVLWRKLTDRERLVCQQRRKGLSCEKTAHFLNLKSKGQVSMIQKNIMVTKVKRMLCA